MSTRCRFISRIPKARIVVATVGSPSGAAATAREIAFLSISSRPYPRNSPIPNTAAQTAVLSQAS